MDATFIKVAYQKDMMKYKVNGEEKWGACSPVVKKFAGGAFKEGDACNITVEGEKEGMANITRVEKVGGASAPASGGSSTTSTSSKKYGSKTPEESEKITRLSVLSSATKAVQTLTGQVDVNTLEEVVVSLYNSLLKEVKK